MAILHTPITNPGPGTLDPTLIHAPSELFEYFPPPPNNGKPQLPMAPKGTRGCAQCLRVSLPGGFTEFSGLGEWGSGFRKGRKPLYPVRV